MQEAKQAPTSRRLPAALAACLLALSGCAPVSHLLSPHPGQELEGKWKAALNPRMGRAGAMRMELEVTAPGVLAGQVRVERNDCLPQAPFTGTYSGVEIQGLAETPESVMEVRVSRQDDALYGIYRFRSGPCVGEWGSLVAHRD